MNANLKKLLHHQEEAVSFGLSATCKKLGTSVLMRVKAQDLCRTESAGFSEELLQFIARATFDFVAVDSERTPLFVAQFDGTSHPTDVASAKQQQENEISRKLLLPLVRVHALHLSKKHHSIDVLGLLLESWFAAKGMPESRERSRSFRTAELDIFGTQAPSSMAPTSVTPTSSGGFGDNDPSSSGSAADVRRQIRRIYDSGKCKSPVPSSIIGTDAAGNYHAVGFIRVTDDSVASAKIAFRNQMFPASSTMVAEELLIQELYQELLDVIRGRGRLVSRAELGAAISAFRMRFKLKTGPSSTPTNSGI